MSRRRCCREPLPETTAAHEGICLGCGLLFLPCQCVAVYDSIVHCVNCGWYPPKAEEAMWAAQAALTQKTLDEAWH